jgi:hypothetical protein
MARRPSIKQKAPVSDPNQAAFNAVRALTRQPDESDKAALRSEAARILGLLGGSKGGKERARRLSKKRRSEIARQGAKARWKDQEKKQPKQNEGPQN